jgi:hypothetical protein
VGLHDRWQFRAIAVLPVGPTLLVMLGCCPGPLRMAISGSRLMVSGQGMDDDGEDQ